MLYVYATMNVAARGALCALRGAVWAAGFTAAIILIVGVVGAIADATGFADRFRSPSEGERVAECRAMPGFPNFDRNLRFSGCEAQ